MPNQGQPAQRSIQSFQPTESPLTGVLPTGLTALGGGLSALAVALATVPPNAALGSVVQTMERIGLDKGPLFLFGAGIAGVGLALRGQRRARASGGAGPSLDAVADHVTSEIESLTAILGGIQVEVNAVRADVHETRREMAESRSNSAPGAGEASDPMFRLAASLDQLGARVDKRMDAARKEMLGAVQAVAQKVEQAQTDEKDASGTEDLELIRGELAGLRVAVAELTELTARRDEERAAASDAPRSTEAVEPGLTAVDASAPALPAELDENAPEAALPAMPVLPEPIEPPAAMPGAPTLLPGFTAVPAAPREDDPAARAEEPATRADEPAPPIPREGLELIDDMDSGRANLADITPPLFPELGGGDL
ncbi:MAG: hypothetical protein AAFU73_18330 [Planctomycetota bacterium]